MLLRLAEAAANENAFDYCIVGTGPAGLSLALSLGRDNRRVLLLEGGGDEWSDESQEIYAGEVIGDPYFDIEVARLRYFGGTSGHWGGLCRTLDETDFLPKSAFFGAHWPIRKADLNPYLDKASDILEIPDILDDILLDADSGVKQIDFVQSPPVIFAEKYRDTIAKSDTIFLCLNANVTCVNTNGFHVTDIDVENFDGSKVKLRARKYIIATGGIENSRLLLWSNEKNDGRLINDKSPLGLYWMEHPHFTIGRAIIDTSFSDQTYYSLTPEKQLELGILNCRIALSPAYYSWGKRLIGELACVAPELGKWAMAQLGKRLICGARVTAAWEQEPSRDNRVRLSKTVKDRFGVPRTELHWRKSDQDLKTVRRTAIQYGTYLINSRKGRIKLEDWVLGNGDYPTNDALAGYHHMGGTRMASDPSYGVVDENCKVFGQDNLYVSGSSVYPTGGHANPTLTIVQLALRLSDHITMI